jgi:hypothetical protein
MIFSNSILKIIKEKALMLNNNAVFISLFFLLLHISVNADPLGVAAQDDTVKALECMSVPVINGKADDACWQAAKWQAIDQVWIPWGQILDPADYSGRYKVAWSSETDRMYFLVEVIDDVLVKGYKYPQGGYYNYDVVEIFFDEDASGGDHQQNQNAFAYHMTAGNDQDGYQVMDTSENAVMNYSDHFDCKIVYADGVYTWEFGMIVYNEDYDPQSSDNPSEELTIGKISGLTIAYCDNDDPKENPKTRDNMIGSVPVPKDHNNDSWINADWFGKVELVASDYSAVVEYNYVPSEFVLQQNYPNPFNPSTIIRFQIAAPENVVLSVFNANGQMVRTLVNGRQECGSYAVPWDGMTDSGIRATSGVYYYRLQAGNHVEMRKMVVVR